MSKKHRDRDEQQHNHPERDDWRDLDLEDEDEEKQGRNNGRRARHPNLRLDNQDFSGDDEISAVTGSVEEDTNEDVLLDPVDVESFADESENLSLDENSAMDFVINEARSDDPIDQYTNLINDYTSDPDVIEDFVERQEPRSGSEQLLGQLEENTSLNPEMSGNDVDAGWQFTDVSGEESVGGMNPTPDQDVVDDLGNAMGVTYDDDEELNTENKLSERDRRRWELDPSSGDPGDAPEGDERQQEDPEV